MNAVSLLTPARFGRISERLEATQQILKTGEPTLYRSIYGGFLDENRLELLQIGENLATQIQTPEPSALGPSVSRFLWSLKDDINRYFTAKTGKPLHEWLARYQETSKERLPFEHFVRQLHLATGTHANNDARPLPNPDIYDPVDLLDASLAHDEMTRYRQAEEIIQDEQVLPVLKRMYHPALVEKAMSAIGMDADAQLSQAI